MQSLVVQVGRTNHAESSSPEVGRINLQSLVVQVGRINHAESSSPGGQN